MILTFIPLAKDHFPLLQRWLESPHVKREWPTDELWTLESVTEKYQSYVHGYKIEYGVSKTIQAFVINIDQHPVGYVQYYNAYDFTRDYLLENLPCPLMAFDMFIGEARYLGKGIGTQALTRFLTLFCKDHAVFADPNIHNKAAIRTYQKAGFEIVKQGIDHLWMIRE